MGDGTSLTLVIIIIIITQIYSNGVKSPKRKGGKGEEDKKTTTWQSRFFPNRTSDTLDVEAHPDLQISKSPNRLFSTPQ